MPERFLYLLRVLYSHAYYRINVYGEPLNSFKKASDVRQRVFRLTVLVPLRDEIGNGNL